MQLELFVFIASTSILCFDPSAGSSPGTPGEPARSARESLSPSEWASLRAAYDAARHAAQPVEGGYCAANPGQCWSTLFDGRGFTTTPDEGAWTWGLELESFGYPDAKHAIEGRAAVSTDGARVSYAWSAVLEEWYENDGRGLEHGYTLRERPSKGARGGGPLTLDLALRGELRARVEADGRGVRFLSEDGAAVLTYTGLCVFDTDGRDVPARFEAVSTHLRLIVQDEGARYPLTIDPIAQQAYLKASNTGTGDVFGWSVSISGDTVLVGAPYEASAATGVDGDQSSNAATQAGAAYVFVRNGTSWSQQAYLKASNTEAGDRFGWSVSVSGDTALVGAQYEGSNATGVDGNQNDNSAPLSGAAYVFVRNGTIWSQQAYLKASNTGTDDHFGASVAVFGDTAIVGATGEDSNSTGVNGDQNDSGVLNSGAAYVFVRNGTTWTQQAFFKASNTALGDWFGSSVGTNSISADDMVLTADFTTNQPGLFFQGDDAIGGGTGVTFGDGIRCCGQNVVRLEIADPAGTSSPHTISTTLPILGTSPAGTTTAGDTRCYQWWYRNPNRSACGSNFNLSNAVVVTWAP